MDLKDLAMEDPGHSAPERARNALGEPLGDGITGQTWRRVQKDVGASRGTQLPSAPSPYVVEHARKLREREERRLAIAQRQADALETQLNESRARETAAQDREAAVQESERVARAQARMANWFAGASFVVAVIALLGDAL